MSENKILFVSCCAYAQNALSHTNVNLDLSEYKELKYMSREGTKMRELGMAIVRVQNESGRIMTKRNINESIIPKIEEIYILKEVE